MTPEDISNLVALALGFAFAGLLATGYQAFTARPASFRMLHAPRGEAILAVPFLAFAAPFIIIRNTIRGRRIEQRRFEFVTLATVIASFWSLMSGTAVVATLRWCGLI